MGSHRQEVWRRSFVLWQTYESTFRAERRRTAEPCKPTPFYNGNMVWEKDGSSLEIRTQGELPDGKPALDEIVARGASVHLEQMAHDHWWMGLEAGGMHFHLNFGVQDGRLCGSPVRPGRGEHGMGRRQSASADSRSR